MNIYILLFIAIINMYFNISGLLFWRSTHTSGNAAVLCRLTTTASTLYIYCMWSVCCGCRVTSWCYMWCVLHFGSQQKNNRTKHFCEKLSTSTLIILKVINNSYVRSSFTVNAKWPLYTSTLSLREYWIQTTAPRCKTVCTFFSWESEVIRVILRLEAGGRHPALGVLGADKPPPWMSRMMRRWREWIKEHTSVMLFNKFTFHSTMLHNEKRSKVKLPGHGQKENANIFHPILFCECEWLILQLRVPDTANYNRHCGKYQRKYGDYNVFVQQPHFSSLSIVLLFSFMDTQASPQEPGKKT